MVCKAAPGGHDQPPVRPPGLGGWSEPSAHEVGVADVRADCSGLCHRRRPCQRIRGCRRRRSWGRGSQQQAAHRAADGPLQPGVYGPVCRPATGEHGRTRHADRPAAQRRTPSASCCATLCIRGATPRWPLWQQLFCWLVLRTCRAALGLRRKTPGESRGSRTVLPAPCSPVYPPSVIRSADSLAPPALTLVLNELCPYPQMAP